MDFVLDHYWFRESQFLNDKRSKNEKEREALKENNKKIICKYCKNHITNVDEAIIIEGSHTHTFSNPSGYVYTINCYRTAIGCLVHGESSSEYTWFSAYEWQMAVCNACQQHLGWLFSNENQFYALIADRLITEQH
jgi:hypothetical protein